MYWVLACCQYNCKSSFELKDKYIPFWSFFQWFLRILPSLLLYQDCLIFISIPFFPFVITLSESALLASCLCSAQPFSTHNTQTSCLWSHHLVPDLFCFAVLFESWEVHNNTVCSRRGSVKTPGWHHNFQCWF